MFLLNSCESSIPRINEPAKERHAELIKQWELLAATADKILEEDIPALNKGLWDKGIGAIRARK
jgi:hypothetical protein